MSEVYQKYIKGEQLTEDEIDCLYDAGLLTMGQVDILIDKLTQMI